MLTCQCSRITENFITYCTFQYILNIKITWMYFYIYSVSLLKKKFENDFFVLLQLHNTYHRLRRMRNFKLLKPIPATILNRQNKYLLRRWSLWDSRANLIMTEFNKELRRIKTEVLHTGYLVNFVNDNIYKFINKKVELLKLKRFWGKESSGCKIIFNI